MLRDFLCCGLRRYTIQLKDADSEAFALIATERHIGDIHIVFAERDPDETDNTGDVLVLQHEQCRISTDLDTVTVDRTSTSSVNSACAELFTCSVSIPRRAIFFGALTSLTLSEISRK